MQIPGKEIAESIESLLKKEVNSLKKRGKSIKLTTILVGQAADQLSFVNIKRKVAERLGIEFDFRQFKRTPMFEKFANQLKSLSSDPTITGIIIQQPLPSQLSTDSIYKYIPENKEIEGHKNKSSYHPPLGMAILTILKYIYGGRRVNSKLIVNHKEDIKFFRTALKQKKIVLIGRGVTGGRPIGITLSDFKVNFININSRTPSPEQYYKEADIIISAVGKKVLTPEMLKPEVVLITAGLRHENGKLRGDYDTEEIKSISSYYTNTPGGVGPLDVLYLYKNIIDAAARSK